MYLTIYPQFKINYLSKSSYNFSKSNNSTFEEHIENLVIKMKVTIHTFSRFVIWNSFINLGAGNRNLTITTARLLI